MDSNLSFHCNMSQLYMICNACFSQDVFNFIFICYLDDQSRIFLKKNFYEIVAEF